MTKRIIFHILFFLCAATSTLVFHIDDDYIFLTGLIPGLLFVLTTIICSTFVIKLNSKLTIKFVVTTYLAYLAIFFLTLFSTYVAFIVGIITGGLGSLVFFFLFNKYIKTIRYSKKNVFILGTLAFIINDIIVISPIHDIAAGFFRRDMTGNFSLTFFLWQYIIGVKLTNQITSDT